MKKALITSILIALVIFVSYWGYQIYHFGNGVIQDTKEGKNKFKDNIQLDVKDLNKKGTINQVNIILGETHLGLIELDSLNGTNIVSNIKSNYKSFQIKEETGQQDGPDFKLYNVQLSNEDLFFISMDTYDSLLVQDIWTNNIKIKDKYGIKVGSSVNSVLNSRTSIQFHSDVHYNIYASCKDSKIVYRLSGNFKSLNDSLITNKDYSVNKNQITEMEVEYLIWRK